MKNLEPVFRVRRCLISHLKSRLESRHQQFSTGACIRFLVFASTTPFSQISPLNTDLKRKWNLRSDSEARQITPTSQHGPKSRSRNGPPFAVAASNPNQTNQPFLRKAHRKSNFDAAGAATVPNRRSTRAARGGGRRGVEVERLEEAAAAAIPNRAEQKKARNTARPGAGAADI